MPYLLHPGDEVEIKFFYSPQLNERETIQPDGKLTLPLLTEDETAAGLTVDQLHDELVQKYAGQLLNPAIEVILRTASANRIFVAGEVTAQGAIPLTQPTSVSQALILAQGLKLTACKSQILVIRKLPSGTVATRVIDYDAVMQGRIADDVILSAGDIVFVPESRIARVDDFVAQYIRNALPVQSSFDVAYQLGQAATQAAVK